MTSNGRAEEMTVAKVATMRVEVRPALLRWAALERAGLSADARHLRVPPEARGNDDHPLADTGLSIGYRWHAVLT